MFIDNEISICKVIECGFDVKRDALAKELSYVDGEISRSISFGEIEQRDANGEASIDFLEADIFLIKILGTTDEVIEKVRILNEKSITGIIHVILYAPEADHELIKKCVEHKIFVVLTENTPIKIIASVIKSSYSSMCMVNKLRNEVMERRSAIGGIQAGHFEVQTPKEAYNLATMLSVTSIDPRTLSSGLFELMSNAIEHGNLEIGYDLKTELLNKNQYYQEIEKRLESEAYCDRKITVLFKKSKTKIKFTIKDQGKGFDPKPFMNFDPKRLMDPHGRGIAMTIASNFSSVKYNDKGNEVTCELKTNH